MMSSRNVPVFWLCLLIGLTLTFEHRVHSAEPAMFEAVAEPALPNWFMAPEPAEKRTRLVTLSAVISGARSEAQQVGRELRLNLFSDSDFTLRVSEQHSTALGGFVFRGQIDNDSLSSGLFVCQNGVMAGIVTSVDHGVFKIQYLGNGIHQIVELEPSKMARCGVDLLPANLGDPSKGSVGSSKDWADPWKEVAASPAPPVDGQPTAQDEDPAVVDIMIVYTELSKQGAGGRDGIEALAQLAIEESNYCFANSGINVVLNLVNIQQADYTETGNMQTDLSNLQNNTIPDLENQRIFQYKADLISMITEREDTGVIAGIANKMFDENYSGNRDFAAFSVVRRSNVVGNYVFPHEIGHNFGCDHDRDNAGSGVFHYSYGSRFSAQGVNYATVMTYPPGVRIPYFSNPNISYEGTPTGIPSNLPFATDNAATINYTAANVTSQYLTATRLFSFSEVHFSGDEEAGSVAVTVRRAGPSASGMSVRYATVDGSASASLDYVPISGVLTFAADETEKSFTVDLVNDMESEPPQSFSVHLSDPEPAVDSALGTPESAIITIQDDENSFFTEVDTLRVYENVGQVSVTVLRGGSTNATSTIDYTLLSGSAIVGDDFDVASGRITFAPGEELKAVTIGIVDDLDPEQEETFFLELSNPSAGFVLVDSASVDIEIIDEDRPGGLVPYANDSSNLNDTVYSVKTRPNGKLLVAGRFSRIAGMPQAGIAQLNSDGTFDHSFDPGAGVVGSVFAVDVFPDGRVLIAGDFSSVNGVTRSYIAVLAEDGSLDESFDPGTSSNAWIRGVAIDGNGKILIGGLFTTYQGVTRNYIARINQNGRLDTTFTASADNIVRSIAVDTNGKIVIGGDFRQINGAPRLYYSRLTEGGNLDPVFYQQFGADSLVRAVAVQDDGKIILGGHFTMLDGHSAKRVGRINSDGSYDHTFSTANAADSNVHGLVQIPSNGGVVISGDFMSVEGISRNHIAKLSSNGSLDTVFDPGSGANALVWSVDTDSAGRVHLGGEFSKVNGEPRGRVATLRVTVNQGVFEPVISPLSQSGLAGGQVRLSFSAISGKRYALDYAYDVGGAWSPIVTNTAGSAIMELVDTNPSAVRRYYRIREVD